VQPCHYIFLVYEESTEAEVEQEAAGCQEAMSSVLDATAKKIRICSNSKRW
jgi:hypothetical protein